MPQIKLLSGGGGGRKGFLSLGGGAAWLGTLNYVVKSGAATLANSQIFDNGTSVGINTNSPSTGSIIDVRGAISCFGVSTPGNTYIKENEIDFGYLVNGAWNGYINRYGYNAGGTQFRNLFIYNGKNALVAYFDGVNSRVGIGTSAPGTTLDVRGTVTVSLTSTCGIQINKSDGGQVYIAFADTALDKVWLAKEANHDFTIGTGVESIRCKTGSGFVGILNNSPLAALDVHGGMIINDNGDDVDCRIEGDTDANLFYTDAGNNRVAIGKNNPSYKFEVAGDIAGDGRLFLSSNSASVYMTNTTGGANYNLALIEAEPTNGGLNIGTDYDGKLAGSFIKFWLDGNEHITILSDGQTTIKGALIANENGDDVDCRIEGDTQVNLFYTDAGNDRVGIGTASPSDLFHVDTAGYCRAKYKSIDGYIGITNTTGSGMEANDFELGVYDSGIKYVSFFPYDDASEIRAQFKNGICTWMKSIQPV